MFLPFSIVFFLVLGPQIQANEAQAEFWGGFFPCLGGTDGAGGGTGPYDEVSGNEVNGFSFALWRGQ